MRARSSRLERGGVIAYPTDTVYGLGCDITNKHGVERIYRMKRMAEDQLLSFVCPDLSDIARYGVVKDSAYRMMRRLVPGPYTFILQATHEVPKVLRMKRKTVGIRVPSHPVALALARELGRPGGLDQRIARRRVLRSTRARSRSASRSSTLVLDAEGVGLTPSTIIDLSGDEPVVVREGAGPVDFV